MQVWASDPTGLAHGTNHLATADSITFLDINAAHMSIKGLQTQTMFNEHTIAIEKVVAGIDDKAIGRGENRCAFGSSDINAAVWSPWLVIVRSA